jgi:hypothetical protein
LVRSGPSIGPIQKDIIIGFYVRPDLSVSIGFKSAMLSAKYTPS